MIRFSENQPWNFGVKPTEYFEQLPRKQKKIITLDYLSWKTIDNLFNYINENCPNARQISLKNREAIRDEIGSDFAKTILPYQSALAVTYCKPITWFARSNDITVPEIELILEKLNIKINKKTSTNGDISLAIGFSNKILKEFIKVKNNTKNSIEFHLAVGILLGYPMGNIFGCLLNFNTFTVYKHATHLVYDSEWTKEWEGDVGWKGENHLGNVYKKFLNLK